MWVTIEMSVEEVYLEAADKMEKAHKILENQFRGVRTGRASRALVEHIRVEYYGAQTPLNQIANIATPDPQLIVIRPFDPSSLKAIEKAILQSDIGITPATDRKLIRLAVPPLSEERRKQLAHQVRQMGEQAKVAIRNIRREANRDINNLQEASTITEDDCRRGKDGVQELTGTYEGRISEILDKKTADIMKV